MKKICLQCGKEFEKKNKNQKYCSIQCNGKSKEINIIGKKYGRLTVIEKIKDNKNKYSMCKCICDCGNKCIVNIANVKSGHTKSCGCLQKETIGDINKKHGKRNTRLYDIWCGIKVRCYNKNDKNYKNYGGRGITICQEWFNNFINFYNWSMANGYTDDLSIDRIDVNGNYEPSNCRWVDRKTQNRNTRTNRYLTYKGETHCIAEWAEILHIKQYIIIERLKYGWSIEKIFETPVNYGGGLLPQKVIKCLETGEIFENYKSVLKKYKINKSSLYKCCSKKQKTCGNLHWEYVND